MSTLLAVQLFCRGGCGKTDNWLETHDLQFLDLHFDCP